MVDGIMGGMSKSKRPSPASARSARRKNPSGPMDVSPGGVVSGGWISLTGCPEIRLLQVLGLAPVTKAKVSSEGEIDEQIQEAHLRYRRQLTTLSEWEKQYQQVFGVDVKSFGGGLIPEASGGLAKVTSLLSTKLTDHSSHPSGMPRLVGDNGELVYQPSSREESQKVSILLATMYSYILHDTTARFEKDIKRLEKRLEKSIRSSVLGDEDRYTGSITQAELERRPWLVKCLSKMRDIKAEYAKQNLFGVENFRDAKSVGTEFSRAELDAEEKAELELIRESIRKIAPDVEAARRLMVQEHQLRQAIPPKIKAEPLPPIGNDLRAAKKFLDKMESNGSRILTELNTNQKALYSKLEELASNKKFRLAGTVRGEKSQIELALQHKAKLERVKRQSMVTTDESDDTAARAAASKQGYLDTLKERGTSLLFGIFNAIDQVENFLSLPLAQREALLESMDGLIQRVQLYVTLASRKEAMERAVSKSDTKLTRTLSDEYLALQSGDYHAMQQFIGTLIRYVSGPVSEDKLNKKVTGYTIPNVGFMMFNPSETYELVFTNVADPEARLAAVMNNLSDANLKGFFDKAFQSKPTVSDFISFFADPDFDPTWVLTTMGRMGVDKEFYRYAWAVRALWDRVVGGANVTWQSKPVSSLKTASQLRDEIEFLSQSRLSLRQSYREGSVGASSELRTLASEGRLVGVDPEILKVRSMEKAAEDIYRRDDSSLKEAIHSLEVELRALPSQVQAAAALVEAFLPFADPQRVGSFLQEYPIIAEHISSEVLAKAASFASISRPDSSFQRAYQGISPHVPQVAKAPVFIARLALDPVDGGDLVRKVAQLSRVVAKVTPISPEDYRDPGIAFMESYFTGAQNTALRMIPMSTKKGTETMFEYAVKSESPDYGATVELAKRLVGELKVGYVTCWDLALSFIRVANGIPLTITPSAVKSFTRLVSALDTGSESSAIYWAAYAALALSENECNLAIRFAQHMWSHPTEQVYGGGSALEAALKALVFNYVSSPTLADDSPLRHLNTSKTRMGRDDARGLVLCFRELGVHIRGVDNRGRSLQPVALFRPEMVLYILGNNIPAHVYSGLAICRLDLVRFSRTLSKLGPLAPEEGFTPISLEGSEASWSRHIAAEARREQQVASTTGPEGLARRTRTYDSTLTAPRVSAAWVNTVRDWWMMTELLAGAPLDAQDAWSHPKFASYQSGASPLEVVIAQREGTELKAVTTGSVRVSGDDASMFRDDMTGVRLTLVEPPAVSVQ